jgi:hypothetical protein
LRSSLLAETVESKRNVEALEEKAVVSQEKIRATDSLARQ